MCKLGTDNTRAIVYDMITVIDSNIMYAKLIIFYL